MDPGAITRPSDCALALAIPWTRAQFIAQLHPESPREFAKWYGRANGGSQSTEDGLWAAYERREGRAIAELLAGCEALGVAVSRECTLTEFAELALRHAVVILVAHWRTGSLEVRDVCDRPRFVAELLEGRGALLASLRDRLIEQSGQALLDRAARHVKDDAALEALLRAVTRVLEQGPLVEDRTGLRQAAADASYFLALNRAALDAGCDGALEGGPGVELCDATYAASAVAAALGGRFAGLLDLVVCNSYLLGSTIKRANPDSLIMVNRDATSPLMRLLVAHQVLTILAKYPANYVQVALRIRAGAPSR